MKKSAFLLLALTLPFAACQSNDTPDEPTKSVAPEAAESMAMATFEFKRANP